MNSKGYTAYCRAINYVESFIPGAGSYQGSNLTAHPRPEMFLERIQEFLDRIGNPERDFKFIHVTGTAGKGSVSSMIQATLVANGKRAGVFTSPFTVSTIEKIQVGRKYINPDSFVEIVELLKPHIDAAFAIGRHGSPSYFELIFVIALLYFKAQKCEYAVLEVGLGGRFDATNVIAQPLVTAITNIGLDHTQILGTTKEKIAKDKAGIIKRGSHFFTTESNPHLLAIFRRECSSIEASYHPLRLHKGGFEERNKLLAASICTHLGIIKKPGDVVSSPCLPGRFEIVGRRPLIIIDGAHNPSKIEATVSKLRKHSYKNLCVVISIAADKDWRAMLRLILPRCQGVYFTRFMVPGRQCADPKKLMQFARRCKIPPRLLNLRTDPIQAFNDARAAIGVNDALLVTGSFYLAGHIRSLYCPEEHILRSRNSVLPATMRRRIQ